MSNQNYTTTTIKAKRVQSRFLIIDELCITQLTIYEMAVYQQLRLLTDFSKEHDQTEITVKSLSIKSKISERQTYNVLNTLENTHFLIKRLKIDHDRYGKTNSYDVARDYRFFCKTEQSVPDLHSTEPDVCKNEQSAQDFHSTAPRAVTTAPHAVTTAPHAYYYKSHNSFQKSFHAGGSPQAAPNSLGKEISTSELVAVYHEVLPDNPGVLINPATGEVERDALKAIRGFKKWWASERSSPLTIVAFRAYLDFMLETCPEFVLTEYTNKGGKKQKNSLVIFLNWETAAKLLADRLY